MPRVAAVVVDRVQILHVLIDQYPYDLEVAIRAIRETCFMQGRPPKLVLGLQSSILKGVLQQLHEVHRQRNTGHPRLDGNAITFFRFQVAAVGVGVQRAQDAFHR